jgi:hypothetical protein
VGNPLVESSRSSIVTANQIRQAASERARLRADLIRWAKLHNTDGAKTVRAGLAASDQALARLTELDVQKLQTALDPPLAGYLRDVQQLVEHGGARLVVLILPLDVQVSADEWRKYGAKPIPMEPSLAFTTELVALCRSLGVSVLDALPPLAAAEPGAFLDKDIHMTPKGHAAVAAALAATLATPPPARAVVSQRSPVPLPDVFKHAPEVVVAGSTAAGCETKQVREWLRVQCARAPGVRPLSAEIDRDDAHEAMALVMPQEVSLLIPVVEGREVTAKVTWSDGVRLLRVAWPAGAPKPTMAFDKPTARTANYLDAAARNFRSPVEKAICSCWSSVYGVPLDPFNETLGCPGAYGEPDAACVAKYNRPPASCPELLACIRRDPSSPP